MAERQPHRGPASLGRIRGPLGTPDVTQSETERLLVNPNFYSAGSFY